MEYTPEIGDKIANSIVAGKSVRQICEGIIGLQPSMIFEWVHIGEKKMDTDGDLLGEFARKYQMAREAQAEEAFDHILDIEKLVTDGEISAPVANSIIKSLQWRCERSRPARYSPKSFTKFSADDGTLDAWSDLMKTVQKDNSDELENKKR